MASELLHPVSFRVSAAEKKVLKNAARAKGILLSEHCRFLLTCSCQKGKGKAEHINPLAVKAGFKGVREALRRLEELLD